ncbi:unnamed protein product [Symbiodinium natans]|uniref:Uncharacterized protein n=1 Tax=Symbiodinium natans TaxID=878477 RepID=A0A812USV2_9DINO|nr:unnamed protein product [Symbiodinium natans]
MDGLAERGIFGPAAEGGQLDVIHVPDIFGSADEGGELDGLAERGIFGSAGEQLDELDEKELFGDYSVDDLRTWDGRAKRWVSKLQNIDAKDVFCYNIFQDFPADVLHVFLMLVGPKKWWLFTQSSSILRDVMAIQLPNLLLQSKDFERSVRGSYTGVVREMLEKEPEKCEAAIRLARCPSAGMPLADDHMNPNADMVRIILNAARSHRISLSTDALHAVFLPVACHVGDVGLASALVAAGADPIHWQQDQNGMPFATPLL